MQIETIPVGPLQSNCYVIYDKNSHAAMVVDPGDEPDRIIRFIRTKGLKVECIVCTHAHFDHIGAVPAIKNTTGAKLFINKADLEIYMGAKDHAALWGITIKQPSPPDGFLEEGDELKIGDMEFKCISTPGHSPGGICLLGEGILLTGDTIFEGSVGRTDLFGGNMKDLKKSFARIMALPSKTRIYPGHGPSTTVGDEREFNFFVHEL